MDDQGVERPDVKAGAHFWGGVLWGTFSGWGLVFIPYAVMLLLKHNRINVYETAWPYWSYDYNISLLLLLPLIQGFSGGLARGKEQRDKRSGFGLIVMIMALDILMATFFMREGVICVIMASPLLIGLIALGYAIGRALARRRHSRTASVSLAPLAILGVVMETAGPLPDYPVAVTDVIVVDAPADYVWRYIVTYPDNPNPPAYWLWRAGLPVPTRSVAPAQVVGAHRECRFSGGYAYGEVITRLEPGRSLVFRVTDQMKHPEIFGHVTFDEGEIMLTPLDAGHTRLTMTGRYRLHVRPVSYFEWWSRDVTRHIHLRIMTYMKSLAETDYRSDAEKFGK